MRAEHRIERDPRRRALALLLLCVLGLSAATAAHSTPTHRHVVRSVAVLAATGFDTAHATLKAEQPGAVPADAVATGARVGHVDTSDSSTRTSSRTARTPQVRGPPGQALA